MSHDTRILIVEDNYGTTLLFLRLLQGYQLTTAPSGHAALSQLSDTTFDLIILDLHLGSTVNGLDVLSVVNEYHRQNGTQIIVISADDRLRSAAEHIGYDIWMTKPFDIDVFVKIVHQRLSRVSAFA